jgi:hypothetical protein
MLHTGNLSIGANSGLTSTGSILTENLIIKHATSVVVLQWEILLYNLMHMDM